MYYQTTGISCNSCLIISQRNVIRETWAMSEYDHRAFYKMHAAMNYYEDIDLYTWDDYDKNQDMGKRQALGK